MPIITDANVLIDYVESDITILAIYSAEIERIIIPEIILDEVEQLTFEECEHYGLQVVSEEMDVLNLASTNVHGPLSFQDKVCLYLTKSIDNAICITNEKALKRFCEEQEIPVKRGLKLMVELVEHKKIDAEVVLEVAQQIHRNNPLFITDKIIEEFTRIISDIN
ncbi:MAG: hypothetical protein QM479_11905 [Pseudomonadota bacterium]